MSGSSNIQLAMSPSGNPFPPTYLVAAANNSPESAKTLNLTSWVASTTFVSARTPTSLTHSPPLDRWVMATTTGFGSDLARSNDQAATWLGQSSGQGQSYDTIQWAFSAFFLGSNNGNIFKSATGLTGSWSSSLFASGLFYRSYKLAVTLDGTILASCGDATASNTTPTIALTTDGTNWSAGVTTGLPSGVVADGLACIAHDVGRNKWWVMNFAGGLYTKTSLSAAGAWTFVDTLDAFATFYTHSIAFQTGGGTKAIIATTGNGGLWVSTDGGITFTQELAGNALYSVIWSDYFDCFIAVGQKIFTGMPGAWVEQTKPVGINYSSVVEALV